MLIPLNVTEVVTDLLVSSSSSVLTNRASQCDTLGHCRTVWNIIWSCLITIFACIWVAVHPNIPQPNPPRATRLTLLVDICTSLGEKLAIALLALLAPEFIFVWALRQWLKARSLAKECREAAAGEIARNGRKLQGIAEQDSAIARQRAAFQNLEALGYDRTTRQDERHKNLRKQVEAAEKKHADPSTAVVDDDQTNWTTVHGFFIIMGGFHQFDGNKPLVYLTPKNIIELVSEGLLIAPSEDEIKDRSKSDSFSKIIVLMQTLWFVMQSIARHIEHLPITELEVATLAYTVPILGIYICWWKKPLGITQPIRIPKYVWDDEGAKPRPFWGSFADSLSGFEMHLSNRPRVPRFSAGEPSYVQIDQADIVTSIITILFGAIHCFAWYFHFPSETERLLWRIASVVTTAVPILWLVVYILSLMDDLNLRAGISLDLSVINLLSGLIVPLYLVARALLLVIAFISLRSLPPAAYETVYWTTFIPHV